ncbi:AFG1 family ATPase [Aureimonas fodinaquatilis]|uniref:AFG1 family ATPase n=1 Tax=Aureimonas fodinaquatilis TaxID=2565783 RepID=A0A5B0DPA4_9HYPH|nr:cell division protein ZapE [Aureimonas fodinaquatilis]KAA0968268.1 AFG1 family ATPase [Aureimonas fodinaquatilis]
MPQADRYGAVGLERGPVRTELERRVREGLIAPDPIQQQLADKLDRLARDLRDRALSSKKSALGWLFGARKRAEPVKGLYIYGDVGRGKSMMMDMFFDLSPVTARKRMHFLVFMADIHDRIKAHRLAVKEGRAKGDDPIPPIADALSEQVQLLCFDEFTVTDIADAMILSRLFSALFERGLVLVATSNVAPENLYRDGLNRALFLPFIDILKAHAEIYWLDAPLDYRLGKLGSDDVFITPLGPAADQRIDAVWKKLLKDSVEHPTAISVTGRTVSVPRYGNRSARFTFQDLLSRPLGPRDYLEMAARFDTLIVENVPRLTLAERNEAKRFIILVDAFYDAGKQLVLSAEVPAHSLYQGNRGTEAFEFDRTVSRLTEMRSDAYRIRSKAA